MVSTINPVEPVIVYRNLEHSKPGTPCWSVKQGDVMRVASAITLRDCVFVIDERRRLEYLETGQLNLHAWVRGTLHRMAPLGLGGFSSWSSAPAVEDVAWWWTASYRPGAPAFVTQDDEPIQSADLVRLDADGLWFVRVV